MDKTHEHYYETLDQAMQSIPVSDDPAGVLQCAYNGQHLPTIFNTLRRVMDSEGIEFRFVRGFAERGTDTCTGRTMSNYGTGEHIIEISECFQGRPYARDVQVYTLLHELAHYFTPMGWKHPMVRPQAEVIAETAAYIVATRLGFEGLTRSADYVKNWAATGVDTRDLKKHSLLVAERLWEAFQSEVDVRAAA